MKIAAVPMTVKLPTYKSTVSRWLFTEAGVCKSLRQASSPGGCGPSKVFRQTSPSPRKKYCTVRMKKLAKVQRLQGSTHQSCRKHCCSLLNHVGLCNYLAEGRSSDQRLDTGLETLY